jgi:hypothetical protein
VPKLVSSAYQPSRRYANRKATDELRLVAGLSQRVAAGVSYPLHSRSYQLPGECQARWHLSQMLMR